MEHLDELYDLCEVVSHEIAEANDKIKESGGKLSGSDVDYIDKLTHTLKSIKTTIAMIEADENGWSYDNGNMGGGSYARGGRGGGYSRNYGGSSYARGRGQNVRRDNMGRYSRDSHELADEVREVMRSVTDERTRQKLEKLVGKIEDMD